MTTTSVPDESRWRLRTRAVRCRARMWPAGHQALTCQHRADATAVCAADAAVAAAVLRAHGAMHDASLVAALLQEG